MKFLIDEPSQEGRQLRCGRGYGLKPHWHVSASSSIKLNYQGFNNTLSALECWALNGFFLVFARYNPTNITEYVHWQNFQWKYRENLESTLKESEGVIWPVWGELLGIVMNNNRPDPRSPTVWNGTDVGGIAARRVCFYRTVSGKSSTITKISSTIKPNRSPTHTEGGVLIWYVHGLYGGVLCNETSKRARNFKKHLCVNAVA